MSAINFSGIASGIDTNGLIDATSAATRKARVTPNQTKVSDLEETNTAFATLDTKLEAVRTALKPFTSLSGGGVSKVASSSKESVLTGTATNAATNGTYDITVNALARNHTVGFSQTYSSSSSPVQTSFTSAGNVSFNIGTGTNLTTVTVNVPNASFSAGDFVNAFNNATTKATASLVNVGTTTVPSYKILVSSNNTGTEKGTIATTVDPALTSLTTFSDTGTTAQDASVTIPPLGTILRGTNSIADIIPGLNLGLSSIGSATVKVSEDAATTTSKIQTFIDAYNEVVTYVATNDTITRDESGKSIKNTFAPLASTRTDDNAITALRTVISSTFAAGGSAIRVFSDLGITTQRDGTLAFNSSKFSTAVATEPSSVGQILQSFADTTSNTAGTIDVYTRFNGLIDISVNSNKSQISNLNTQISEAEKQIARTEENMRARFARLESQIGKLQQQQSSLTASLNSLS